MNKVKQLTISLFIFAIGIFVLTEHLSSRLVNFSTDQIVQLGAAKQLAQGNGLNVIEYNEKDISNPILKHHSSFPPGHALILSPFFYFSSDIHFINNITLLLSLLVFLFLTHRLIESLTIKKPGIIIYALLFLFAVLQGYYVFRANSSDVICLNIYLLSALFLIKYTKKKRIVFLILACAVLPLSFYFRYAYLPILASLPGLYIVRVLFFKTKEYKELVNSLIITMIVSLPIIYHIYIINVETGYFQSTALDSSETLFYWENLKKISPFPIYSFFDHHIVLRLLGFYSEYGYDRGHVYPIIIDVVFYLISILLLLPIFAYFYKEQPRLVKKKRENIIFLSFSIISSIGLIFLIFGGSLINPSQVDSFNWSWVQIPRYFLVPIVFIQISYIIIFLNSKNSYLRRFIILVFACSLGFLIIQKSYTYTKFNLFDFKHNTSLLFPNKSLYNSYIAYERLQKYESNSKVALVDEEVYNEFFKICDFLKLANITSNVIDENFDLILPIRKSVDVFVITNKEKSNASNLINVYDAYLFYALDNICIYHFKLIPDQ